MTLRDIELGVETALNGQWPDMPVYRNQRPEDFVRPSFLVKGGPVSQEEMGGAVEQFTAQVTVTAFLPVDAYNNSNADDLFRRMSEVMALFAGGYVQIGDRCPHVTVLTGDYGLDYAAVAATLRWHEAWETGEEYPLMRELKINTK
ncbi:MAG: hypothetical protein VB096_09605 [Pseudoflavonifractor sp.]|nr:hypothetical protein [Pseudoflavonifractor sp.]